MLEISGTEPFFVVGGKEDREAANTFAGALRSDRVRVLAGELDVRETFALLERCRLLICNDGAPGHYAALAGCDVLPVFCNWEAPGLWEPIAARRSVPIRPGTGLRGPSGHGITSITVPQVLAALCELETLQDGQHRIVTMTASGDTVATTGSWSPFRVSARGP